MVIGQAVNPGLATEQAIIIAVVSAAAVLILDRLWRYGVNAILTWWSGRGDQYASMSSRHRKGDLPASRIKRGDPEFCDACGGPCRDESAEAP